jgi:hypothetical protein
LDKITCVLQHFSGRAKRFFIADSKAEIVLVISWQGCYDLLNKNDISFFVTNKRTHLVVKKFIEKVEDDIVRIQGFTECKIEIVRENRKAFECWMAN